MSEFKKYDEFCESTALYPGASKGEFEGINYCFVALGGEVGEVLNKWKKVIRDDEELTPDSVEAMLDELGDCLYYISRAASELGSSLDQVANKNYVKLSRRKSEGKIHGSGDKR